MKYKTPKETTDFSIISDAVCEYFEVNDKIDIFKKTRKREIINQRQWFHYFARILNPEHIVTSSSIGAYYSDVTGYSYDHATVLHSIKKIKGFLDVSKQDALIKSEILYIIKRRLDVNFKPPLKGNCITQPFSIKKYSELQIN